jgi:CubicO group peptidase (beta-lactamase class C family)
MTLPMRYEQLFELPQDAQVRAFADMRGLYPTREIRRGAHVRELPTGAALDVHYEHDGRHFGLDDFIERGRIAGLLVLDRGRVVLERYALGHTPDTRWISFSMAKSIASTLVGAAVHNGAITSLDEPVTRSVPRLRGSAYDGVTIRQVLQMSSGVRWVETYLDPASDRRRLLHLQAAERPGAVLDYLATLARAAPPGSVFNYSTGETFLLGAILTGAFGRPVCEVLSEKIWQPLGMQADAYWQLDAPGGQEFTGSGLSATLRDYARFADFVLGDGVIDGKRVLPEGWVAMSSAVVPGSILAPGRLPGYEPLGYGFQWWTFPPEFGARVFGALGIFGQQIYIDVDTRLVIVLHAAWPEPVHEPSRHESYAFFRGVVRAVRERR